MILLLNVISFSGAWETAISGVIIAPPAQGPDGRIYSSADDRALHCLDEKTGKEFWAFRPGRRLSGFTVVSPDGRIFVKTIKDSLVCVSPGGRELWRYQLECELKNPPASDVNGTVYLLQTDGSLHCLDRHGRKVWTYQAGTMCKDLFALEKGLLLMGTEETIYLNPDGLTSKKIDIAFSYFLYRHPVLFARTADGEWGTLDTNSFEFTHGETPVDNHIIFPEKGVLITSEGQIVSGREDWFMQAMDAGETAYDPYFQDGANPLRSRGIDRIPEPGGRRNAFNESGGNLLLPLLNSDSEVLSKYLASFEKARSLQELMSINYDYDLALYDIIAEANIVSSDVLQIRTDSYSRSRIYEILTKWGDLRLRNSLLQLARMEKDTYNLALIMDGLGRIGLDKDGRSMDVIRILSERYPSDRELQLSSIRNAALLARYNGGRRILEMMDFYNTLQNRTLPRSLTAQIRREMHSF